MSGARIDDWFWFGNGLVGMVSGHKAQDTFNLGQQWTSRVVEMHENEGWCLTESGTRYTLGKKREWL